MSRSLAIAFVVLFTSAGVVLGQGDPSKKAPPQTAKQIDDLIAQLGDAHFKVREEASRALVKIGRPAKGQLEKAKNTEDLEIRMRVERILREIDAQPTPDVKDLQAEIKAIEEKIADVKAKLVQMERARQGPPLRRADQIALAPDGKLIAAVSTDGGVIFWDVATAKEIRRILPTPHLPANQQLEFSADGKTLVATSPNGAGIRWDVASGAVLRMTPAQGHPAPDLEERINRIMRELEEIRKGAK